MTLGRAASMALQVVAAQAAGGLILHHAAGSQRSLAGGHRRHPRREPVHGHAQAAGGRAGGQERTRERPGLCLQARSRRVHAYGDVAGATDAGRRPAPEGRASPRRPGGLGEAVEGADDGGGGADLGDQHIDEAGAPSVTAPPPRTSFEPVASPADLGRLLLGATLSERLDHEARYVVAVRAAAEAGVHAPPLGELVGHLRAAGDEQQLVAHALLHRQVVDLLHVLAVDSPGVTMVLSSTASAACSMAASSSLSTGTEVPR